MTYREVKFVPGLYKIFDEILVNAADNKQRDHEGMDTIRVDIDKDANEISVFNNGRGNRSLIFDKFDFISFNFRYPCRYP